MDKLNGEANNNANVEAEDIGIIEKEKIESDSEQEVEGIKDSSISEREIEKLENIPVTEKEIEEIGVVEEEKSLTEKEVEDINVVEKEIEEDSKIIEQVIEEQDNSIIEEEIKVQNDNINEFESNKINNRKARRKERKLKVSNIYMRAMSFIVMSIFLFGAAIGKAGAISFNNNKIALNSSYSNENSDNDENNTKNNTEKNDRNSSEKKDNKTNASNKENNKSDNKYKNTSAEGQKFIYDAVEVAKKLKNCDYQNGGKKIIFLTFDDGASNTVTPKILKVLDDYNVKATFFIMGSVLEDGGENAKKLVKEEYNKGHAIGNHSYCHDYSVLYPGRHLDLEAFKNDYSKNENELKKILGDDFSTRVIRCPGGYMSWKDMDKLNGYLNENNMTSIDWSALSGDAEGEKKDASQLLKHAVESSMNQEMVVLLMHDTYGKEETANSLPKIIEYFKGHGYEFRTLG
ncbi:MAG TPA: polysaccharide deacetylase [Clostridium sp.]|nr:polysaccharide deacetylase [Clostridium sp.]